MLLNGRLTEGRMVQSTWLRYVKKEYSFDLWLRRGDCDSNESDADWVFSAKPHYSTETLQNAFENTTDRLRYFGKENNFAIVYVNDAYYSMQVIGPAYLLLIRSDQRCDGGRDDLGLVLKHAERSESEYQRLSVFIMRSRGRDKCFGLESHNVEII